MVVIGMGLLLAAYAVGMYGFCLLQGYDVTFRGLWGGTWPGGGQSAPATAAPATDPGVGTYNV